jgi:4-aminobutyrate aminotransferase
MGRTGRWFGIEHSGVVPDIVTVAKGIASGFPLGAMVSPAKLQSWDSGAHATTFGGNPVACAAALKTIDLIAGGLMRNAERTGNYLREGLRGLMDRHEFIGDVRGLGLMIGVEIVKDRRTKTPDPERRNAIVRACFRKGLLLLGCGHNTLRFCPALTISRAEAGVALEIVSEVLRAQ